MSEHAPDRIWSGIEISKVIAGTLAAITAAVVGSFLGVAGTLAGAAVASVVGSVGTEIYQRSLNRGAKRLSAIAPTFVKAPAAVGTPPVAAAAEEESPSHTVAPSRNIRWGRVGIAAAALFVLALGSLTAFELIAGEPLASAVGASSSKGTSVGNVFKDDSAEKPTVTPSSEPTEAPASDAPQTEPTDGTETGPTTAPTTEPTDGPTEPATEPTTEPTTEPPADTPEQTPPADMQEQQQDVAPQNGTTTE
jgi:hypothetical protein